MRRSAGRFVAAAGVAFVGAVLAGCADRSAEASAEAPEDASGEPSPPFAADTAVLASISVDSLFALGRATYDAQGLAAARAIWEFGLERARSAPAGSEAANEARLLTWLGLVAYDIGDYERAERLEHEALAIERAHGLGEHLPVTFNALVLIAWQRGRLAEAARWSDSTFAAARVVGDASYHAKALVNLGNLETALGELDAARDHMRQGLAALRELGDAANESRTLVNLAALERDAGNLDTALDFARRALELSRAAGDTHGEEAALGQLASLHLLSGRHEAALATVDSALARARAAGLRPEEAENLEILAGLHRQLGHLPRALRLYDSARAINLGLEERAYETGLDLYHMAEIQAALGNLDVARVQAEQARELHAASGWATAELSDLLLLAEVEALAGEPGRADERLEAAGQVASDLGLRTGRLDVALAEARIADHGRDDERLLAVLGAIEDDLPVAGFAAESEAAALRARALARRGDLTAAEAAGRHAIELIGRARGQLTSGVFRSTLAHSHAGVYADLVDVLLRRGRTDEAYEVATAAGTRFARGPTSGGGDDGRREELLRRIGRLAAAIRGTELDTWDPDLASEPVERLREARREYESLLAGGPGDASVGHDGTTVAPRLGDLRSALRSGEALLHYLVGDEHALAFVVTRAGAWATRLAASPDELATRVRLARQLLAGPGRGDPASVLEALHAELIGPLAKDGRLAGAERLIVIPHGVLAYLPFAALRDPATGRWLAEEAELLHLPDA
ncbi:MAG: tetratricopeptide repeat protein, partial [Gemmatimonadota bacterium]